MDTIKLAIHCVTAVAIIGIGMYGIHKDVEHSGWVVLVGGLVALSIIH